jgi:hypothetical protein
MRAILVLYLTSNHEKLVNPGLGWDNATALAVVWLVHWFGVRHVGPGWIAG